MSDAEFKQRRFNGTGTPGTDTQYPEYVKAAASHASTIALESPSGLSDADLRHVIAVERATSAALRADVEALLAELAESKLKEAPAGRFALQMRDERDVARAELAECKAQLDVLIAHVEGVAGVLEQRVRKLESMCGDCAVSLRNAIAKAKPAVATEESPR